MRSNGSRVRRRSIAAANRSCSPTDIERLQGRRSFIAANRDRMNCYISSRDHVPQHPPTPPTPPNQYPVIKNIRTKETRKNDDPRQLRTRNRVHPNPNLRHRRQNARTRPRQKVPTPPRNPPLHLPVLRAPKSHPHRNPRAPPLRPLTRPLRPTQPLRRPAQNFPPGSVGNQASAAVDQARGTFGG